MTDETTPDAVAMLQRMHARAVYCANHGDVPRISSAEVLAVLRATEDERARHAEEVAEARRQKELWRQETASLQGAVRKLMDQLEAEEARVTSLRSLLPDVRACARFTYRAAAEGQLVPEFSSAQKLLAADFLREPCPECHMVDRCKMSCSRGGSKGGRFSVSLDSRKDGGQ